MKFPFNDEFRPFLNVAGVTGHTNTLKINQEDISTFI
jgi:hypothetical protein